MKKFRFVFAFVVLAGSAQAQCIPDNMSPEEFSNLQTDEFGDYFNLSTTVREEVYKVNYTCWSKVRDMQLSDHTMEVKKENEVYNRKIRENAMFQFLTTNQQQDFVNFQNQSQYNQLNNY